MLNLPDTEAMYRDMARELGNQVRCRKCGTTQQVDPAQCLRRGWPKCCGATMTIDPPKQGATANVE
jgi:hypothetical protein